MNAYIRGVYAMITYAVHMLIDILQACNHILVVTILMHIDEVIDSSHINTPLNENNNTHQLLTGESSV